MSANYALVCLNFLSKKVDSIVLFTLVGAFIW